MAANVSSTGERRFAAVDQIAIGPLTPGRGVSVGRRQGHGQERDGQEGPFHICNGSRICAAFGFSRRS